MSFRGILVFHRVFIFFISVMGSCSLVLLIVGLFFQSYHLTLFVMESFISKCIPILLVMKSLISNFTIIILAKGFLSSFPLKFSEVFIIVFHMFIISDVNLLIPDNTFLTCFLLGNFLLKTFLLSKFVYSWLLILHAWLIDIIWLMGVIIGLNLEVVYLQLDQYLWLIVLVH